MLHGPPPHELGASECWTLLGDAGIGRLAVTLDALPVIVPARYEREGNEVCVCVGDRFHLASALTDTVVALSVDSLTSEATHGWFVHMTGHAHVTDADQQARPCRLFETPLRAHVTPLMISGATYRLCDRPQP